MARPGIGGRTNRYASGAGGRSSLAKHFPYFIEKTTLVLIRLRLEVGRVVEFFEHGLFFRGHVLGCPDVDMDELVASFVGVDTGEALAFQPEDLAALRAWGYFDLGFAIDRRYFRLQSEDGIGEGDM